ncbi:MAG: phosphoribosyltransferase family protein [Polyangia bacterium]
MFDAEPPSLLRALGEMLWVARCGACDAPLPAGAATFLQRAFCPRCLETIEPLTSPRCPRCAAPFDGAGPDHLCARCLDDPPSFERVHSRLLYGGALAEAISRMKYGRASWLARQLSPLLPDAGLETGLSALVVPIPLHPARLRRRGFNQAALLAAALAKGPGRRLETGSLARLRDDPPQAARDLTARLRVPDDAFGVRRPRRIAGRRVLLVDDVVTTTATARAAAKALKRAGAAEVEVLCLARTP